MAKRIVNKNLKEELEKLTIELIDLNHIGNISFKTIEEFEKYRNENIEDFERFNDIKKRIKKIEYLLLSDKEKEDKNEYLKNLKNKFSN